MNLAFEELIQSYLKNGLGQSQFFLPELLATKLKQNLLKFSDSKSLFVAGIGLNRAFHEDHQYRKDKIIWMESPSENEHEKAFFVLMDEFVLFLNKTCYTGITNYEFHYTLYEKGSFYKKHVDQFAQTDSRVFSIIFYLNEDWKEGDGGELLVYRDKLTSIVQPIKGRMVFFDSAKLPHEVLETNVPRMSITGWLRRD